MSDAVRVVEVSARPIDATSLAARVGSDAAGAVVVFLGTVRNHSPGKEGVTHLEYEAFGERVEAKISEVVARAAARWPLLGVAVAHRVGRVDVGEASVGVAVGCAHRMEAFEAGRFIIDELKAHAPIWKKEHWPGGAEWVEGA